MSHTALITNGEIGSSVRTKLNKVISHVNSNTGWGSYTDDAYTSSSPLVIAEGTTVNLTNNKATVIESELPQGTTTLYDGTRLIPKAVGDVYTVTLTFKAASSAHAGSFSITYDKSSAGNGSNIEITKSVNTVLNVNQVQDYSLNTAFPIDSTALANGILLRIKSISGILSLHDFTIFINKNHEGHT